MPSRQPRMAEHRVELVQFAARGCDDLFDRDVEFRCARSICCSLSCGRNSCSGGSSKRIVAGSPSAPGRCRRNPRADRAAVWPARFARASLSSARIISRIASIRSPSKNMCSVRQRPMPVGAERDGVGGLLGRVGVGAHMRARARLSAHFMSLCELLIGRGSSSRRAMSSTRTCDDFRRRGLDFAGIDFAGRAVDRDVIAFLEGLRRRRHHVRSVVIDLHVRRAADADLAHLPRDERRVRGDAAARGQDAFGRDHAAQVFGRSLDARPATLFRRLPRRRTASSALRYDLAGSGAGTGRQTAGDDLAFLTAIGLRSKIGASRWSS